MSRKSVVILVLSIVLALAVGGIGGYFVGFRQADIPKTSFYAHILVIDDSNSILVEGIPENDINHRGRFWISLKYPDKKTSITDINGNPIDRGELGINLLVRVTYTGPVQEISPAVINEVLNITLMPE